MYHALFAAIGNAYGGNGTSSFNVPDFRGIFLRGAQMTLASGGDPDVNLRTVNGSNAKSYPGSTQTDAIQTHQHLANCNTYSNTGNGVGGAYTSSTANVVFGASNGVTYPSITTGPVSNNGNIQVSSETRPVNAYVNYIIKY
jgi:microcystin-dependent protein